MASIYDSDFYKGKYVGRNLCKIFTDVIERIAVFFSCVYIIIDGLDEIVDREELLQVLNRLSLKLKNLNLLVLSRPEKDIESSFIGKPQLLIREEAVRRDISSYVEFQFQHDPKLNRLKSDLKEEIKKRILQRSGGM